MKRNTLALLHRTGTYAAVRRLRGCRCVILTYHGVLKESDPRLDYLNDNFPDADTFERQIEYVARRYRLIRLEDLVSYYERGERPPAESIAVTFDDGFASTYTVGFPVLQRYGVPFSVFLTTGMLDTTGKLLWTERVSRSMYLTTRRSITLELGGARSFFSLDSAEEREAASRTVLATLKRMPVDERDRIIETLEELCGQSEFREVDIERYAFLSWSQVRTMAAAGVEIGSHTVGHPMLATLSDTQLAKELVDSKNEIEAQVGRACRMFAYPNGTSNDFGPREKAALRKAGYRCALAMGDGSNGPDADVFALRRINIGRHFDLPTFGAALCGLLSAARHLRATARAAMGDGANSSS